jgi:three-Cys-motif partner protein
MQEFGSFWTEAKLDALERYLSFYTRALKNSGFNLCYIDAFAGSGSVKIKGGEEIEGSVIRALRYPFNKFHFFEKDEQVIKELKRKIISLNIQKDIEFHQADANNFLTKIDKLNWQNWRGVIFLDPFAMDLEWTCLTSISKTGIFDVWYLFPFMAVNRNLYKNGKIPRANKEIINRILGTDEWEQIIYSKSLDLFGEEHIEKETVNIIKKFIIDRLQNTFPTVSPKAVLLKNERNSPQFLLCFAGSNPSPLAKNLSLKAADYILSHM